MHGAVDIDFPPELVISSVAQIVRQTGIGRDASGAPVEQWSALNGGLAWPATVWLRPKDAATFGQAVVELEGKAYFPPASLVDGAYVQDDLNGSLPDVRNRDRLQWGVWPETDQPRWLVVNKALDPLDNGTMIVCWVTARAPQ